MTKKTKEQNQVRLEYARYFTQTVGYIIHDYYPSLEKKIIGLPMHQVIKTINDELGTRFDSENISGHKFIYGLSNAIKDKRIKESEKLRKQKREEVKKNEQRNKEKARAKSKPSNGQKKQKQPKSLPR